jgi:hypothetical protein
LDEPAAIKSGRVAPAVAIGSTTQLHGGVDDR